MVRASRLAWMLHISRTGRLRFIVTCAMAHMESHCDTTWFMNWTTTGSCEAWNLLVITGGKVPFRTVPAIIDLDIFC